MATASVEKARGKERAYLLVKASAAQVPLADNSVGLVIATPPYLGVRRVRKGEYCTSDPGEYRKLLQGFLAEATRVVKPNGYILLQATTPRRSHSKVFEVLQKRVHGGSGAAQRVRRAVFRAPYVDVKDFRWAALPVRLYRALVRRYSDHGETVAHVFSGSGNGGIAAVELGRKAILIDLHYHRQTKRRLRRRLRLVRAGAGLLSK